MERMRMYIASLLDLILPRKQTRKLVDECTAQDLSAVLAPICKEDGTSALLPYRHSLVRAVILEGKFHNSKKAQKLLGRILAEYLEERKREFSNFGAEKVCIVPIPLSAARRKQRGYNQIEKILEAANIPYTSLLVRTRETRPQMTLVRTERLKNVVGVFALAQEIDPTSTYLVIDDVTTTGATLMEAVKTIQEAGGRAEAIAIAY